MTRINTNVSSLVAQNRLQASNKDLQTALTRLSTGLRINSGSDDPAGLIASEALRSEITSLNKSISNTRRASQIISTADSALGQVSNLLNDIRGLVVEAANSGALSPDEVAANQLQVDSSLEAINRIAQTTTFQGRKLLDGSLDFITTNGPGASAIRNLAIGQANLGASGRVDVTINVSRAATQAAVNIGGFGAGGSTAPSTAASGTVTIGANTEATAATATLTIEDAVAASGTISVGADTITITATQGGADGNVAVNFVDAGAGNATTAAINSTTGAIEISYDFAAATAAQDIEDAINTLTGFSATGAAAGASTAGTPLTDSTLTGGADATEIVVTADATGPTANGVAITFIDAGAGNATSAAINTTTGAIEVSYDFAAATTAADIQTAIDGLTGYSATVTGTGSTTAGVAADDATLAGGAEAGTAAVITINADEVGSAGNVAVTFIDGGASSGTSATINTTTGAIEVTYNFAAATSASAIQAAIDGLNGFSASVEGEATTVAGTGATDTTLTGGFSAVESIAATGTLTIAPAVEAVAATGTVSVGADTITVTADTAGTAGNVAITFLDAGAGNATSAAINSTTGAIEVSYDFAAATSSADIQTAIDGLEGFSATGAGTDSSTAGTPIAASSLAGGIDAADATEITVTSNTPGAAGNVAITFINGGASSATTAAVNATTGAIEVTYDFAAATSAADIVAAINGLEDFTATLSGTGATTAGTGASNGALTGGATGGVQANVVFELASATGSEVFNISAGTSLNQVVSQINLVADATGVTATANGATLELRSVSYGSSSVVDLRILSQGEGGNFGTGSRGTGTDVQATVNGRTANGTGNRLSLKTATLDMTADLQAGFTGDASFTITGGGAQFQLGPDVVSNQQARIGIGSVNSARLGGVSGKLFELGSGEAAALAVDPTRAAAIVNEAIAQVTGLRGRLGAFQATSLDSNLVSLSDTVANLQEAESSIRDADFAAESAALTRAQILVQSGTNVLSLANQNPQNVLALLR
jgi:flagellin